MLELRWWEVRNGCKAVNWWMDNGEHGKMELIHGMEGMILGLFGLYSGQFKVIIPKRGKGLN